MKKVVLLGDSIRLIGYGTVIKDYLPGYEVWQPEDNCRYAKYTLRMLFEYQEQLKDADIIHWNNGLWDTGRIFNDGISFSSIPEYVEVMCRIADLLLKITPHVIFSTITPIREGQPHNDNETIKLYNKAVVEALKEKGIIINDLYSLIAEDIEGNIREDDCVHLKDKAIHLAAKQISGVIKSI